MKTDIKPIEMSQPMSRWELASVMEQLSKIILATPNSIITNVEYAEQEAYAKIEYAVKRVNNRLVDFVKAVDESSEQVDQACTDLYNKTQISIRNLNGRLAELPKINEDVRLPHNIKTIIEVAEHCQYFTDDQWQRVIDLAKAFSEK